MQFFENLVFFSRQVFDASSLLLQFFEHRVLPLRNAVHPPKTNSPATDVDERKKVCQRVTHCIRIVSRHGIGGATPIFSDPLRPRQSPRMSLYFWWNGWSKKVGWVADFGCVG